MSTTSGMTPLPMEAGTSKPWTCGHCSEEFSRKEHLRRHESSHLGLKPFRCELCSRTFSRRDTLARHRLIHQPDNAGDGRQWICGRPRSQRACRSCAQSKQRCNGAWPCLRCTRKSLICEPVDATESQTAVLISASTSTSLDGSRHGTLGQHHEEMPTMALSIQAANEVDIWPLSIATRGAEQSLGNQDAQNTLFANLGEFATDTIPPLISQEDSNEQLCTIQGAEITIDQPSAVSTNMVFSSVSCDFAAEHQCSLSEEKCCCVRFPEEGPEDDEVVAAEDFGHVAKISDAKYRLVLEFWRTQQCARCKASCSESPFVSLPVLNTMIQLYYEYYDPWMPFLHLSVFDDSDIPWVLILAVASVGAQYSDLKNSEAYVLGLHGLLQRALNNTGVEASSLDQMVLVQCLILRDVGLLLSGHQDDNRASQYQKNMLATLSQSIALGDDTSAVTPLGASSSDIYIPWRQWILSETRRRTVYCIWIIECFHFMFMDAPSSLTLDHFRIPLPSSDELWKSSPQEWHQKFFESRSISEPGSLRTVLVNPRCIDHLIDNTSKLRDLIIFLTFYVEERRVLGSSQPWFAPERIFDVRGRAFFEWPDDLVSLKTSTDRYCDPTIDRFNGFLTAHHSPPNQVMKPVLYTINIIRRTPLRCLYALSGWQANNEQVNIAAVSLSRWMQQNPTFARESLLYAVSLYNDLYDTASGAGFHHLAFLVATLYIWAYFSLNVEGSGQPDIRNRPCHPLRLDKHLSPSEWRSWTLGISDAPIFIKGVGMLVNQESALRVLKGFRKSLSRQRSWPSLRRGLLYAVTEMIEGRFASYAPRMRHGERSLPL